MTNVGHENREQSEEHRVLSDLFSDLLSDYQSILYGDGLIIHSETLRNPRDKYFNFDAFYSLNPRSEHLPERVLRHGGRVLVIHTLVEQSTRNLAIANAGLLDSYRTVSDPSRGEAAVTHEHVRFPLSNGRNIDIPEYNAGTLDDIICASIDELLPNR